MTRPETGPMQFGDDWPGVFIRGDNAMGMRLDLQIAAAACADPLAKLRLHELAAMFGSADVRTNPTVQQARLVED